MDREQKSGGKPANAETGVERKPVAPADDHADDHVEQETENAFDDAEELPQEGST